MGMKFPEEGGWGVGPRTGVLLELSPYVLRLLGKRDNGKS